jgi:alpha-L-arabinofuranosidase
MVGHKFNELPIDMNKHVLRLFIATAAAHLAATAAPVKMTVQADKPGPQISPTMWGVFFEDINFGADGGLYAELVKNRSFEFPDPLMGWIKLSPSLANGKLSVQTDSPLNANNPHYLRMQSEGTAPFGISNEGFRGMGLLADETYDFTAQVRFVSGAPRLLIQLVGEDGTVLAEARLEDFSSSAWKQCTATLKPNATESKARLNVILENKGAVELDMISLFPRHTWKDRPGGLRADMVQLLADFKPGFMRFPGGCIVEGSQLDRRYQWKNTIGPVEERKLLVNRWNYEFIHRPTPDYFQSFGLGFFEFFQLCEDIGSEPLPILNCGMACQFNSGELCPLDQLEPFIQDALDLVEFANGPADSPWGAKRAAMGHPEPFHLKMMGVGNEQWGPQYIERYARFAKALKAKYPEIMLVSASGPSPDDERFKFLWSKLRELHADIVDEHCYANPSWFFNNTHRYDDYDRNGPKVFMGEYAAQSVAVVSVKNRNIGMRACGGGLHDRPGAQRRCRAHGVLRPALRQFRSLAMDAGHDLGQQPAKPSGRPITTRKCFSAGIEGVSCFLFLVMPPSVAARRRRSLFQRLVTTRLGKLSLKPSTQRRKLCNPWLISKASPQCHPLAKPSFWRAPGWGTRTHSRSRQKCRQKLRRWKTSVRSSNTHLCLIPSRCSESTPPKNEATGTLCKPCGALEMMAFILCFDRISAKLDELEISMPDRYRGI